MQDLEEFRVATRQWLEAHCPAAMRQPITQEQIVWGGSQVKFSNDDQRVWFERMRDRGWFAPGWPAEFGGGGLTPKQARIVEEEMAIRSKLLEHVAHRIIKRIFNEVAAISRITLAVSKLNPPIGGDVEAVTIEMEEYRN